MIKTEKIINKTINEISHNRAKILDDFCKAYVASRWDDYFSKKIDFRRLELVEQRKENEIIFFFRLQKGKLSKKINGK